MLAILGVLNLNAMPLCKSRDLTHTLVGALKDLISTGGLQPGGRLPPERELARQFGVNRASVRQALKALEVMGIVNQRVGDGTYLTHDASTTLRAPLDFLILVDGISFQELFEARRIVEPELAARAAMRRSPEDLAELEQAVRAMTGPSSITAEELAEQDLRFHEAIWRASGNRVCQRMFSSLHRFMARSLSLTSAASDVSTPLSAHHQLLLAIRDFDADQARHVMMEHLLQGESIWLQSVENAAPVEREEAQAASIG